MARGVLRYVAAALLATLLTGSGLYSPASAHTELDNAIPAARSKLTSTPGSVQLTFTEPVDASLASVVVRGPDGADLAEGPVRQSGPGLMQPIVPAAKAGKVEVDYRVVSLDGHPVSGTYTFTVLRGDPNAPSASQQSEPAVPAAGGDGGSGVSLTGPLLGAALVVLLVVAGAFAARRRRRNTTPQPPTSPPSPPTPSTHPAP